MTYTYIVVVDSDLSRCSVLHSSTSRDGKLCLRQPETQTVQGPPRGGGEEGGEGKNPPGKTTGPTRVQEAPEGATSERDNRHQGPVVPGTNEPSEPLKNEHAAANQHPHHVRSRAAKCSFHSKFLRARYSLRNSPIWTIL